MTEWLTYAEAAARFGISSEAVRQIAIRRHWPRRKPNDAPFGQVQVGVPDDFEARPRTTVQHPSEHPNEQPSDARSNGLLSGALATLEEAVGALRGRAEAAEARADRAEAAIAGERARADAIRDRLEKVQHDLAAAQSAASAANIRADEARAKAQAAQDRVEELAGAEEARKARGRLRRAWDGWRGR